jgi:hypothetical protein
VKKIPPFGEGLFELQQQGKVPIGSVYLWIGDRAWYKGAAFSASRPFTNLLLPPWLSSTEYIWPVRQCNVCIFDTGYAELEYVEELAYCLLKEGATNIHYSDPYHNLTIYHKE